MADRARIETVGRIMSGEHPGWFLYVVHDTAERLSALGDSEADVREAGHIAELVTEEADALSVTVELAS